MRYLRYLHNYAVVVWCVSTEKGQKSAKLGRKGMFFKKKT